ncbi:septum site-determining protein [Leptolyngbya sp. Heron Island J]|uniref:septum site-determining protein MinC n=1 Tax=Leptolyngbya sp. Heron Island J TaxID=1385935 RepID=UPI0003B96BBA|nr:septum site-determining protein MinC [Leptolyngbya sp. Heron Island J]ESA37624.1 septum site-determining protein [Leptolyngbya sp. Heron Island J]
MDNGADNQVTNSEGFEGHPNTGEHADTPNRNPQEQAPATAAETVINTENETSQTNRSALSARLKASKNVELYVFEAESTGDADTLADVSSIDVELDEPETISKQQITFKSEQGRLLLLLPAAAQKRFAPVEWEELLTQLKQRLSSEERFFQPNTTVHLIARDRLLDSRQLQEMDELLQTAQLRMKRIYSQRRQTAVAAATAGYSIEQQTKLEHLNETQDQGKALETPLYLQMTVRSGTEIRHPGSIIVLGDVNPGGSLIAAGDIFVWGRLRGLAHAGSEGNGACRIMALHMQPTQLRIADKVARAPEKPPVSYQPEVAYVNDDGIRIAIASEFAQIHLNVP